MSSRADITTRFARAYGKASKKDKRLILDQVMSVTGWSRDNARRRLAQAAKRPPGAGRSVAARTRKPRTPKYSYDSLKVLQRVWAAWVGSAGTISARRWLCSSTGWSVTASWRSGGTATARTCARSYW